MKSELPVSIVAEQENLIHQRIHDHSIRQPNNIAVRYQGQTLSYRQLWRIVRFRAKELRASGAVRGTPVVVALEPGLEILPYIVAIMSIGGIYVPTDLSFPEARLLNILGNFTESIVVVPEAQRNKAQDLADKSASKITVVSCGADLGSIDQLEDFTDVGLSVADESHIFFTSGTTGHPKGVVSSHKNLIHYVDSAVNRYGFKAEDCFLCAAKYTFSISLFELLIPLSIGACVQLIPRATVLDLKALAQILKTVTVFHFGPSLLKKLLPYLKQHDSVEYANIRHASSGGDFVPLAVLSDLRSVFSRAEIYVIYGCSEVNCMAATFFVSMDLDAIQKSRVGLAHQNVAIKILNQESRDVPTGETGFIYIAGPGVAKGYLNLPSQELKSFHLFDGVRYYSTGDLGRLDADGDLEVLGRADFQVKIKGVRIELQEIEKNLLLLGEVADAVVVSSELFDDMSGNRDPILIAYIVFSEYKPDCVSYIRQRLRSELPEYMLPNLFVRLASMPLNHNGKLDRSQLPSPKVADVLTAGEAIEPQGDVEQQLSDFMLELNLSSPISRNDSFFDVGGDSLAAVTYLKKIEDFFDKHIPISWFYHHPTIAEAGELIRQNVEIDSGDEVVVLKQGDPELPPLFCLYGIFLYRDLALELSVARSVCGVYLEYETELFNEMASVEDSPNFISVTKIATLYLNCIKQHQENGPYYLCGESFGGIVALEVARLLIAGGEKVSFIGMFDSSGPHFLQRFGALDRAWVHAKLCLTQGLPYILPLLQARIKGQPKTSANGGELVVDYRAQARKFASSTYEPEPFTDPVVLFRARERSQFEPKVEDLGWAEVLPKLTVRTVEGDHLGMLKKGCVFDLAQNMKPYL